MFRISKISTFESNSQPRGSCRLSFLRCSEYQRYQLLRAIHNTQQTIPCLLYVVPNIKDINFWEQFTTSFGGQISYSCCSEYQRYQLLRAIHNAKFAFKFKAALFRISKISTFESNSQHVLWWQFGQTSCSEYQRYQLLRAIHNKPPPHKNLDLLFRISKISTFESNSQLFKAKSMSIASCSEYQRYQLLRAIHNPNKSAAMNASVVPNIKDINFWEQFTTFGYDEVAKMMLFRISKISTFESNSQLLTAVKITCYSCSEYQRYQLLRAIHNINKQESKIPKVVPNIKDINFWEQFTTGDS